MRLYQRFRKRVGSFVFDNTFQFLTAIGRIFLEPWIRGELQVLRDVPYLGSGHQAHRLDIYLPRGHRPDQSYPVVLYIHGGAFRILSKESHWMAGIHFARRGFIVFNINYRLAPQHPFPAPLADVCAAYRWIADHAVRYGGDLDRFVIAGESAGANLTTALTIAACYERHEPWAKTVWNTRLVPRVALPHCGILQVSDPGRFARRRPIPTWVQDRLAEVDEAYLAGSRAGATERELADPLLLFERGLPPDRPLPAYYALVGTHDPLLDDTRRLKAALDRLDALCEVRYYPRQWHGFHLLLGHPIARRSWREQDEFLARHLLPRATGRPLVLT